MTDQVTETTKFIQRFILMVGLISFIGSSISCAQSDWRKTDAIFNAMDIKAGSWVADVGGGDGDYTVPMSPIVEDSGHIFLVDIDQDKLEELHEELEERNIENVSPVYSVPGNPMLPGNSLDAILIRNAYHEFRNYMAMLNHMKSSLKPGGRLVMVEPMEEEVAGADRAEQMKEHSIAMKYVRTDLKETGYNIVKEVEEFISTPHQRYWMIIAERPS